MAVAAVALLAAGGPCGRPTGRGRLWYVKVDPQSPTTVCASMGQGLYQRTDGGYSWSATAFSVANPGPVAIDTASTPHTLYASEVGVLPAPTMGVYKSTDNGGSWPFFSGSGMAGASVVTALAVDTSTTPSTIVAGTGNPVP